MTAPVPALQDALTIHHAAELKTLLLQHLADGVDTLDLSAVTECDTAGLQLLLAADRSLRDSGRRLHLQAVTPALSEVLQRCGLPSLGT